MTRDPANGVVMLPAERAVQIDGKPDLSGKIERSLRGIGIPE